MIENFNFIPKCLCQVYLSLDLAFSIQKLLKFRKISIDFGHSLLIMQNCIKLFCCTTVNTKNKRINL